MDNVDDNYDDDSKIHDESLVRGDKRLRRCFRENGTLSEEAICDSRDRNIEVRHFNQNGAFYQTTIYEYANEKDWRAKRIVLLDAEGDLITSLERGSPPVVGEYYAGEMPYHVYPKKKGPTRSLQ